MKRSTPFCAALLAIGLSAMLTGCATGSREPVASSALYQPRILRLEAGQVIATRDGTYLPKHHEVWHSPAAFDAVETQLLDALATLDQVRSRPTK